MNLKLKEYETNINKTSNPTIYRGVIDNLHYLTISTRPYFLFASIKKITESYIK